MYYFASDLHLGLDASRSTQERERLFVSWLDSVSADAKAIFLVGDIFDFWFEYSHVIPKGFTRILGKISELSDRGVEIHFFCGNHDMWSLDYFEKECGATVHYGSAELELYDKMVHIEHGNLVPRNSVMVAIMNAIFCSTPLRWLFRRLIHPSFVMRLGHAWSSHSRKSRSIRSSFNGEDEPLVQFSRKTLETKHIDYFIYGHLHCLANYALNDKNRIVILGEWIEGTPYARLSPNGDIELLNY